MVISGSSLFYMCVPICKFNALVLVGLDVMKLKAAPKLDHMSQVQLKQCAGAHSLGAVGRWAPQNK